ncbi:MAG: hypothetical protein JOZ77_00090 [Candidatus Eremiobacteraeota bacterium]|nr:hypothetical protein [Candidatus Eremiobacteraeota bacterium]
MKASRGVLLVALALLAIAALRDFSRLGNALPWHQLYDFADFYCAGAALDLRADPYRYEPLHRCEHAVNASAAYRNDPARIVPAPLPPYAFPPFMLLARFDFATARAIDTAAIVLAVIASIAGLGLLVPVDVAALALILSAGYVLLNAGQVVPFSLVALVFCGVALSQGRDGLAGVLAALVAVEPHLGLPVGVALLLWVPRSRLGLIATGLALAGVAVLVVGLSGTVEFLGRVLPAQALAESGYVYQYSLTYALRALGAGPVPALIAGNASYVAMLVAGVAVSRPLARKLKRRELFAYLPAAFGVLAGAYVHMVDLSFAVPAALVLTFSLRGPWRQATALALCLLAVPWIPVWIAKKLFLASAFVVAALLVRLRAGVGFSLATFAAIVTCIYVLELAPPAPLVAVTPATFAATDLAQRAWAAYVERLPQASSTWLAVKLPSWIALALLLAACLGALRNRRLSATP